MKVYLEDSNNNGSFNDIGIDFIGMSGIEKRVPEKFLKKYIIEMTYVSELKEKTVLRYPKFKY